MLISSHVDYWLQESNHYPIIQLTINAAAVERVEPAAVVRR